MFRLLLIVFFGGLLMTTSSCCEKRLYCESDLFDFAFTGFQRTEARSFILRKYSKGDSVWTTPIDTAHFVYTGATSISTKPDTLYFSDYNTTDNLRGITAGNDWTIYMPSTRQIFYVTTIFENENHWEIVRCKDDSKKCSKAIRNFSLDFNWRNGGFAFLEKR